MIRDFLDGVFFSLGLRDIVAGRPIIAAADSVAAARAIIDEIEAAGAQQPG